MPSLMQQITGREVPYWIIVAGGKFDYTIKWWHFRRWQAVVDHFQGRILFVQVGEKHHYHPPVNGVLDLRGKTSLRELIHLVYHAQGVLCPVTLHMHLAAAVEGNSEFPVPGEQGWQNQIILDAAYRSLQSGKVEEVRSVVSGQ